MDNVRQQLDRARMHTRKLSRELTALILRKYGVKPTAGPTGFFADVVRALWRLTGAPEPPDDDITKYLEST